MRLFENKNIRITLQRYKYRFHWKLYSEAVQKSYHRHENGKNFQWINSYAYFIPTEIYFYWMGFRIWIQLKPKLLSGKTPVRYVDLKKTHLELLNLPHGSWQDK